MDQKFFFLLTFLVTAFTLYKILTVHRDNNTSGRLCRHLGFLVQLICPWGYNMKPVLLLYISDSGVWDCWSYCVIATTAFFCLFVLFGFDSCCLNVFWKKSSFQVAKLYAPSYWSFLKNMTVNTHATTYFNFALDFHEIFYRDDSFDKSFSDSNNTLTQAEVQQPVHLKPAEPCTSQWWGGWDLQDPQEPDGEVFSFSLAGICVVWPNYKNTWSSDIQHGWGDIVEGGAFVFFPSHSGFFLGFCFAKVGIMLFPSMVVEEVEQLVLQHKGSTCFSSDR